MARLRIQQVVVQVVAFADDGEHLEPLPVQPVVVPWSRWQEFIDGGFKDAIEGLRAQVEQFEGDT